MSNAARVLTLLLLLNVLATSVAVGQDVKPGSISGVVVDKKTGEALLGVNVFLEGTQMGAATDLEGAYNVRNVPPGTYSIRISSVDYNTLVVNDVVVLPGEVTKLSFTLETKVLELDNVIRVTAEAVQNTEAVMLKDRQASSAIQDAISTELMSKSGASSADDAVTKITGATVVNDKAYFRGLGERYGGTQLNNMALPGIDAGKSMGVSLDLIPTNLLDNIVVTKNATPDKPGDFAGGIVNMTTKDFPDKRALTFSTSISYNTITTGKDVIYQETISPKAWLADDDGYYNYPTLIDDDPELWERTKGQRFSYILVRNTSPGDTVLVQTREAVSTGFSNQFQPTTRKAPWNQSYTVSFGDDWRLFDRPFGVTATYNYSRKFSNRTGYRALYENGTVGELYDPTYIFDHNRLEDNYQLGGMVGLNYSIMDNHKIGWRYVYNRDASTNSVSNIGPYLDYVPDAEAIRDYALYYRERSLKSSQFDGKHAFFGDRLRFEWNYQSATTRQDTPDLRAFTDEMHVQGDSTYYQFTSQINALRPQRIYQALDGSNRALNFDFEIPVTKESKLKFGSATLREERSKSLTSFDYANFQSSYNASPYNGDPNSFFEFETTMDSARVVSNGTRYYFSSWVTETALDRDQYNGKRDVDALYGMLEFRMPLIDRLKVVGGVRSEKTDMWVIQGDGEGGSLDQRDDLYSLNLIYSLSDRTNLRLSYGQTLARPTIREISPGADQLSEDGTRVGGLFTGNPNLKLTMIDNYDLRWEWFRRPGEVFAATLFLKEFTDPIEIAINGPHGTTWPVNTSDARVMGIELEMRSRLDIVWDPLSEFTLGGNLTLVDAWMRTDTAEFSDIRTEWPDADDRRDMYGQSPYIVNADLSWDHFNSGTSISMFYNLFGERLQVNSNGTTADVYEMPRHQLDMTLSQRVLGTKFKLGVKNILDEDIVFKYLDRLPPEGQERGDQEARRYNRGITYSIGVSYDIW